MAGAVPKWYPVPMGLVLLAMLGALLLPWLVTDDSPRFVTREGATGSNMTIVLIGAVLLGVATLAICLGRNLAALLVAAVAALLVCWFALVDVDGVGTTCWDGRDAQGNPVGGCYDTTLASGPWTAGAAAVAGVVASGAAVAVRVARVRRPGPARPGVVGQPLG